MKNTGVIRILCLALAVCLATALPAQALADEWDVQTGGGYFTVHGPDGDVLLRYGGPVSVDDEYISENNRHYRIDSVDEGSRTATAVYMGEVTLADAAAWDTPVSNSKDQENKLIAMYYTHTDESYIPTDGVESKPKDGGILDVGAALKQELEKHGAQVVLDETNHYPHDAGAYRRSRQTAARLMKQAPVALIDIHRDGIPADEYEKTISGEQASKVRLEVGRANQNRSANLEFAKRLKATADKEYPGLVKDIYMGKGNYNQELMPQAILIEFGTHEIDKERVIRSTEFVADVLTTTLFGASGQGGASPAPGGTAAPRASGAPDEGAAPGKTLAPGASPDVSQQGARQPLSQGNPGAATGLFIVLGVLLVGGGIFLLFSRGRGTAGEKVGGFTSEITGGAIGNRRKKDEDGPGGDS